MKNNILCKAKGADGTPCKRIARTSGYCSIHELKGIKTKTDKEKYIEIIRVVLEACEAKQWKVNIKNKDNNFRVIIARVSKKFGYDDVKGLIGIIIAKNDIIYSIQKTSTHGYGLDNLIKIVSTKIHELDWTPIVKVKNYTLLK